MASRRDMQAMGEIGGSGAGTREDPWRFAGAGGSAETIVYRDRAAQPPALVVEVGGARYLYPLSRLDDFVDFAGLPQAPPIARLRLRSRLAAYARSLADALEPDDAGKAADQRI